MRRHIALLAAIVMIMTGLIVGAAAPAYAWNPFGSACGNGGGSSAACQGSNKTTDPIGGNNGVIFKVIDILSLIAGVAAVIIIIIAGIKFILSNSDSSAVTSARNTIIYSMIGLIVIVLARNIVIFVLTRAK